MARCAAGFRCVEPGGDRAGLVWVCTNQSTGLPGGADRSGGGARAWSGLAAAGVAAA
jgi:hypothetical protein